MQQLQIEDVKPGENWVSVTTSGAYIWIGTGGITLTSRVDPATNVIGSTFNRTFGRVMFDRALAGVSVGETSDSKCEVFGDGVYVNVTSDGLVSLENQRGEPFSYIFRSDLPDPEWTPTNNGGLDRTFANERGGCLHMTMPGSGIELLNQPTEEDTNAEIVYNESHAHCSLPPGDSVAFHVFPTKPFDYENLYGVDANPHVAFVYRLPFAEDLAHLKSLGVGTLVLFESLYLGQESSADGAAPVYWNVYYEYRWKDTAATRAFIAAAHALGIKVLAYCKPKKFRDARPDGNIDANPAYVEELLLWQRHFWEMCGLDGWYFDQIDTGLGWWADIEYADSVREIIGNDGLIFMHSTVDSWGGESGCQCVPLLMRADYVLRGEHESGFALSNAAMRHAIAGYGSDQSLSFHKLQITGPDSMTTAQSDAFMVEHGGAARICWTMTPWGYPVGDGTYATEATWLETFKAPFDAACAAWRAER